jgi:pilus assembly protein CpaF
MSTIHANSAHDAISRLETLTLLSGTELPLRAVREQIASALDLVVHLGRMPNGERKVVAVSEVAGTENGEIRLTDLYLFKHKSAGKGKLEPTGATPTFLKRLAEQGVDFPPGLFRPAGGKNA